MFLPVGDNINRRTIPIVPMALVIANLFVFAYQTRILVTSAEGFEAEMKFFETFGLIPAELENYQVMGILSYMFVHGGVSHLLGNMFVLWAFGGSLEFGLGKGTLLAMYMVWGIVAGLTHAIFSWGSEIPLIGASGAIAGMIGAYTVAYGPAARIRGLIFIGYTPIKCSIPAMVFGAGWFMLQLWSASIDPEGMEGTAWYCHIGGFVTGAVTMWIMRGSTQGVLVQNNAGDLVMADRSEIEGEVEAEVVETFSRPITPEPCIRDLSLCPYCESPLENAVQLAETLYRCPNDACSRLLYLDDAPQAPVTWS